ncbi:MAG: TIGR01777 family oxidoreductase [Actinomycetota bacterium]|nr:TIGR01777 family protein [Geodermatophilaceae bacterium]MDQ3476366.1 TIGR01777 family oxidoreductase [Actinomycetota bacterium]
MKVAITGSSGLIGTALSASLRQSGHNVVSLVRRAPRSPDEIRWNPGSGHLDPAVLADVYGVVHLAGAGIGDRRWTESRKRELLDSRVRGTAAVADAMAKGDAPGRFLISASGVHYYGTATGDEPVDESAPNGTGFLADVCRHWESAADPAREAGIRVVHPRSGLVLARSGGVLGRLLPLFRLGLGGRIGDGKAYWPWISLTDEVAAIRMLIDSDLAGPVNLTAPEPVTNAEFTKVLGSVVHRPTLATVPAFALRTVIGEFADEGILSVPRAVPRALTEAGFSFTHPDLRGALEAITRP